MMNLLKQNKIFKIGILIDQLVPGGVQKSAINEAKELIKLGFEVTLFVLVRLKYSYRYQDITSKLKVIYLSDFNPKIFRIPFRIPYFAFLTHLHIVNPYFVYRYKILKTYDLIISHGTTTCITAEAIYHQLHIPYIAYIWDPMMYILDKVYSKTPLKYFFPIIKPLIRIYEQSFLQRALLVITSFRGHQQFIQNQYHVDSIIIHPGCSSFGSPIQNYGKYILGYSRWELAKNPQIFLWLAKKLPKSNFLIAGTWTNKHEREFFKNQIIQQKLSKQIKLLSSVSESNLKKIAQQCLVWLHPNFEAFGMSGLEMASYGLPLIMPKGSGLTEIFKSGVHGFFPHLNSKNEYLKYLNYILNNPKKARFMGQSAAKIAHQQTWKKHAQEVISNIIPLYKSPVMVILEICQVRGTTLSGGDKLMEPMVKLLINNFDFLLITSILGSKHWKKTINQNKVTILPKNIFDYGTSPIQVFLTYCLRMISAVNRLSKFHYNYLYSSTNILPDILPAYFAKKRKLSSFWIARIHHLIPPPHKRQGNFIVNIVSFLMQILSLRLIKDSADIIITLNNSLKKDLIERGFPEKKLFTLGAGIDVNKIKSAYNRKYPKYHGVYLGRLHPTKGVFDLVPIWERVIQNFPKAKLVIIGDGPENIKKQLTEQILTAHLSQSIILTGYLSDKKVYKLMRNSKIFIFSDHEAGWGLAVAEAMACGLPVIGYDLGILGSVFKSGYIKIPPFNTMKFAENIVLLLKNHLKYQQYKLEALREVQAYSWPKITNNFINIIKNVYS